MLKLNSKVISEDKYGTDLDYFDLFFGCRGNCFACIHGMLL